MKTNFLATGMFLIMAIFAIIPIKAQEEEKSSPFSVGADLVSSYVWRGCKIGTGPNIQPSIEFATGGFTIGTWGSYSFHEFGDFAETDLFASYAFDFGLSLGISDYYYEGTPFFSYSGDTASHAFEINLGYEIKNFAFSANYILNDASKGGPENKPGGGDMYFEANYFFENFGVFIGGGNGWHADDNDAGEDVFAFVNIGLNTSKELKVTETYSIPVFGSISLNPDKEVLNLVVGISF